MVNEGLKAKSYRDLIIWQKGITLVKQIYKLTRRFPAEERFGLVNQMRRAAVSVPSNVAEGQARRSTREFMQFISHSEGSVAELDTQLTIAVELEYCAASDAAGLFDLMSELRRMMSGLRSKLRSWSGQ